MWKIALGFIAFAALAMYVISTGGDIDMGGEKHDMSAVADAPASSSPAASAAASAASH